MRWWDPRPHVDRDGLLRNGPRLVADLLEEPSGSFGLPPAEALEVARALEAGEPGPASAVIGRGPGLTPAGDDVVAGTLAVLALLGRLDASAWREIRLRAATHTTALSAALLAAASTGQVVPQAARLLRVLAAGRSPGQLRGALSTTCWRSSPRVTTSRSASLVP